MNSLRSFATIGLVFCCTTRGGDLDMRDYELVYEYSGRLGGDSLAADIVSRPLYDTTINGVEVTKYRFIEQEADSADTSYDYLHITDSSVVNYAWSGNTPLVLLKRADFKDSLYIEETPYTTVAFPYALDATWPTRPESTGVHSIKKYVGRDSLSVPAGVFYCNRIHIDVLVDFQIDSLYGDQWTLGNTVLKTYIDYGRSDTADNAKPTIEPLEGWELFELKSYEKIEPAHALMPFVPRSASRDPSGGDVAVRYTIHGRAQSERTTTRNVLVAPHRRGTVLRLIHFVPR